MNLLGKKHIKSKKVNFVMNGYWSLKCEKEHELVGVERPVGSKRRGLLLRALTGRLPRGCFGV